MRWGGYARRRQQHHECAGGACERANNAVSFKNNGALTLGSIGLLNGVQTNNGDVLIDSGQLTIQQPIVAGTKTVRLVSSSGITRAGAARSRPTRWA